MSVRFTFNNTVVDKTYGISLIETGYEEDIQNIFGYSLKASLASNAIGTAGNYFPDSAEAQAILTDMPSPTFRNPGGTNSWANSRNPLYNGHGSRYYIDTGIMPFESNVVSNQLYNNSEEKVKVDKSIEDEAEPHNYLLKFEAGIPSINDSGEHSYVITYHTDWNGSSYGSTEIDAAMGMAYYDFVELGNEFNGSKYKLNFPTADQVAEGGYGWDSATQTYVAQNRDFLRTVSQYIKTNYAAKNILITAPPPEYLLNLKANTNPDTWGSGILRQQEYVDKVVEDLNSEEIKADGWVHHIYNQIGDFISTAPGGSIAGVRDPNKTMAENALDFLVKKDISGQMLGDYPFHGLKGNYVEYIFRNYITPYEDIRPGLNHTVTEWSISNHGTGFGDTMLCAANVMKYLLAFNRVNEKMPGKLVLATYQKFNAQPPKFKIANDRAYSLSIMFPAQPTNFWKTEGIYIGNDFQPSVEMQVFKLFKSVEGGKFLGTTKNLGTDISITMDEDVAIEMFEDSVGNKWLYYVNLTDNDITINLTGTNTYIQGDSAAGFSGDSIVDEWISGTYSYDGFSGDVTNYPIISINSAGSDNTLRARTVGRIEL
jgi:hypothetical protein